MVSLIGLYPARRVSRGRRRGPSRPCRVMSAPAAALRPPLRAYGIAFAPAPSLRQSKGRKGGALSGSEAAEDRQQGRGRKAVTARNRRRAGSCRAAVLRESDGQGCAGVVAAGKSACPPAGGQSRRETGGGALPGGGFIGQIRACGFAGQRESMEPGGRRETGRREK